MLCNGHATIRKRSKVICTTKWQTRMLIRAGQHNVNTIRHIFLFLRFLFWSRGFDNTSHDFCMRKHRVTPETARGRVLVHLTTSWRKHFSVWGFGTCAFTNPSDLSTKKCTYLTSIKYSSEPLTWRTCFAVYEIYHLEPDVSGFQGEFPSEHQRW